MRVLRGLVPILVFPPRWSLPSSALPQHWQALPCLLEVHMHLSRPGAPCSRATHGSCACSLRYLSHTPLLGTRKALIRHNPCLKCPTARRTDRCAGVCSHPGWKCSRECRCPGTRGGGLRWESRAQGAEELSSRKRGQGGILQDVVRWPHWVWMFPEKGKRKTRAFGELLAV